MRNFIIDGVNKKLETKLILSLVSVTRKLLGSFLSRKRLRQGEFQPFRPGGKDRFRLNCSQAHTW